MENMTKEALAQQIFDAVNDNEDLCRAFVSSEDAASVQKVLNENGFNVTVEDVEALFEDGVNEIRNYKPDSDELSEDELGEVAGGGVIRGLLRTAVSAGVGFGYGVLCGVCPAAAVGAPYVAGGLAVWSTVGYKKKGW